MMYEIKIKIKKYLKNETKSRLPRLASVGILGREREPGVGKLGWNGNFIRDLKGISIKIPCAPR